MWRMYRTPTSVAETLRLLAEHGDRARILAGGTDLLVEWQRNAGHECDLIDVTRIPQLDLIRVDDDGVIHLGPALTHNQSASSEVLAKGGWPLAQACRQVGTPQVRNRGTVAGNLVTASPANDTITALWALNARLTLDSLRGRRVLPVEDFYAGVRRTAIAPDELVTDIAFPALGAHQRGVFLKLGLRRANAIALVNAAVILTMDGPKVSAARIALGSVAPTVIRSAEAERALLGNALDEEPIAEAAGLAAQSAAPISDVRSGAEYRRTAVRLLVQRALAGLRDGGREVPGGRAAPMLWGRSNGRFPHWAGASLCHGEGGSETIECVVNGEETVVAGAGGKRLLDMLREDLRLTGTKEGCGEGECGACTVFMDGIAVLACLVPAPRAHGTRLVTIEGMAPAGRLHPVQQAMIEEGAVQCGYCSPGFVMAGASLLDEIPDPTREQVAAGLSGNLCRCTGYYSILRAVEKAAGKGEFL